MREVVLRVPSSAVERVLDRLLPIVPGGVREIEIGRHTELRMRGPDVPPLREVKRAAGRWALRLTEHDLPDDWRERRLLDYRPDVIAGRLVVRPAWAPPAEPPLSDIVVTEQAAFGAGTHPTTRACLEVLMSVAVGGSFADLGCGTGVLAILAAKLGFSPVLAFDVQPESVEAVRVNAAANGVSIAAEQADLTVQAPPPADLVAANVPASLHLLIAAGLPEPLPRLALLSGFGPDESDAVIEAYAARGLNQVRRSEHHGWVVALVGETPSRLAL